MTAGRRRIAAAVATTLLAVVVSASPAAAIHQYCGAEATGVHLGGYPGATRDNGHPDGDGADAGYAGVAAIGIAKNVALTVNRVSAFLGISAKLYDVIDFQTPIKELKLAFTVAGLAADIAGIAADAAVLALEQRAAEVNACNDVLGGDTIDLIFVGLMQEELAALDPATGTATDPSSLFLLPDDGSPQWTQFASRYTSRPGHPDLEIPYVDGFANTDAVGVATVVRNTIAHLEAHGISTGGGFRWDPEAGLVYQDGAKDVWWDGIRLLEDGRVRLAYAKFAEAYRMAVALPTSP